MLQITIDYRSVIHDQNTCQNQQRYLPNISRIKRALSPIYLSTMALETTFKKLVSRVLATARARRVLPVPGGPYSNTPLGGFMPTRRKSSGFISGSSITYSPKDTTEIMLWN